MSKLDPYELEVLEACESGKLKPTVSVLHKYVTGKLAEKEPSSSAAQRGQARRSTGRRAAAVDSTLKGRTDRRIMQARRRSTP